MRKIKAFGCIVLVIASVMVFSLASVPEVASLSTPTEEDFEFMEWVINTIESFGLYSELSQSALEDKDYEALEVWAGLQHNQFKNALNEIDQFDVSAEIQPIKDEFKLYLQDNKQSLYYLHRYAKYRDGDDIDASNSYKKSAIEHLGRFTYLLQQSNKESATPTPEATSSSTSQMAYLTLDITSEDLEYIEWSFATNEKIGEDVKLITAEMKKMKKDIFSCDWEYVRTLAKLEYNHAETALTEIDQFEVSPELEPIKKEEELFLINRKWVAHYLIKAAENVRYGDYDEAADNFHDASVYSEVSNTHLYNMKALVEALPTPSPTPMPTPESPGYEAIFALSSLLGVAYLVIRRRG